MPEIEAPVLFFEVTVPVDIRSVWDAWTTEQGIKSFLAPECRLGLIPGGAYEMYFDLDSPAGLKGGEGCRVLAVDALHMLSFTWNAPPELPTIRSQYTHVTVRLKVLAERETLVQLTHDGWGSGVQWEQGVAYFQHAWGEIVLPRLHRRFETGPIQWES